MHLKQFIRVIIFLPLCMGGIIIGLLHWATHEEQLNRSEIEIAQQVMVESSNLAQLSRDITQHPSEKRAPRQWQETYQRLDNLMQQITLENHHDHVEVMQREQLALNRIFGRLIEVTNPLEQNLKNYQFRFDNIENQIVMHSQALSSEAEQLITIARQDLVKQRYQLDQVMTLLILLLVMGITTALGHWGRRTLARLRQLCHVTEIIGTGNFDFVIGDKETDELGDFARAMDTMIQKIKHIEQHTVERNHELQTSNRQLNKMLFALDRSGIGVEIIDVESGRFQYVNACTCEMLGYSEAELLNMTVADIDLHFHSDRLQRIANVVCTRGQSHFETIHRTRNGHDITVEITAYYQDIQVEHNAQFIAFVSDITERKASEEALIQAKRAAENANRAKSVFLANMSHELRTPLNAILGFAQLMARDTRMPEEIQPDIQTIIRSGQQLLSLINDVLEISSIETGHLRVHLESINLPNLLSMLADSVQVTGKNIQFHFETSENLPEYIQTDFGKLRRIIQNLLNNAIKFTTQGTITLRAYTVFDDAQLKLCVAVTDTGVGIADVENELLFKPFFQSDYGMNLGTGTGLGLYISQEYAKLLGGEIIVDSTLNKGSTFSITLPVILADNENTTSGKGDVLNLAAGQSSFRILVVDDQPANQHLISELLKQVGFQVCAASNGQEAVQCFQTWQPHFIYMDVRMPVMNGCEATRIIRAMSGGKRIPIIALTASVLDEDHPEILVAGCNGVLKKPVEPNVLFETIAHYLNIEFEYGSRFNQVENTEKSIDLSKLPEAIRRRLYVAAIGLDIEMINSIFEEIEPNYRDIASYLRQLANEFQFELISTLTAPV